KVLVARYRQRGLDIELIHRSRREGYKAGALTRGLETAKGEFIAVFDADFLPPRDWLRRTVPYLVAHPSAGFLQTRWGHINATYSPLTMAQAIILDGHFAIEHTARYRSGYLINFNGTAGLWRRACIEDVGGWLGDTLTEDLDLSYRAQLAGWRSIYLLDVVTPAEIPPQIAAFKRQQFRWAKGSAQCLRRLAVAIWRSHYPLSVRLQGLIHLSGYLSHLLMLVILLLSPLLLWWKQTPGLPMAYLGFAGLGPPLVFAASQFVLYRRDPQGMAWWHRVIYVPLVLLLGTGIALNNARAVVEGLLGRPSEFRRTPKFRVERRRDRWADKRYALTASSSVVAELLLGGYALATMWVAWERGLVWALPFLMLYAGGFVLTAAIGLWQDRLRRQGGRKRLPAWVPAPKTSSSH
ncbi:MAG: glycosyltransferase, partial [Anaerolineae bacterium]|nr:glycosyltransferase [Anaerolineae bacterium]